MKKIITLLVLLTSTLFYAQSSGITYQAVLYNPSGEILPGNNNMNAVLSNKDICLRFSITDAQTSLEYQETQKVKTDEFGMVNLLVGSGSQVGGYATNFNAIVWNSSTKKLQVEIDVTGTCANFIEVSNQNFSAVPFAYASKTAENVSGIVPITNGGTGATTVTGAKTNLGLNNVDNTSDINKPISLATQTALNEKENAANKSTSTALGTSDMLFPTQNAVKTYVDNQIATATIPDATTSVKGKIKLAGDLGGTADVPTVPGLATKENAANKSTSTALGTSDVLFPTQNAVKTYVDSQVSSGVVDASGSIKGKIKLAGDLGGTADVPTVPGLTTKENTIAAGTTSQYYRGDKTWQTLDKTTVGLSNVDNTADADKPVSTATQTALNLKENTIAAGTTAQYYRGDKTWQTLDKTTVGLPNVDNTADADKPVSTATQTALNLKENTIAAGTTAQYYRGDKTWQTLDKTTVGLPNVDNTADADKPVSTATQTAIDLKANLASPTFTGDATAATATTGDNDTSIATTAFVSTAITNVATPNATTATLGKIQLGGDLAGPSSSASVPVITNGAITTLKLADASVTNAKLGEIVSVNKGGTGSDMSNAGAGYVKQATNGANFTTVSSIPVAHVDGAVSSVNGVAPVNGNVSVFLGRVFQGDNADPAQATSVIAINNDANLLNNTKEADIYIVVGNSNNANNGRTFIFNGTTWLEVATNLAATDSRYVNITGDVLEGNLEVPTTKKIIIADAPANATDAANKAYVDTKVDVANLSGTTNFVPKFSAAKTLTDSSIFDDGTKVGIGTASPASKLDVSVGITSVNSAINTTGSINDFLQYNIQNTSTGSQAQSGYSATADNGSATTGFAWLGINNSGFNYPTAYNIGGANDVSFIGSGQDMYLANANNTKSIIFSTGKSTTPFFNEQMRILNNGNVGIGTTTPTTNLQINNPLTATASVNANAQILRLSRPTTSGLKWDNIAQFNLGSYSTAIAANSRLDLALTDGGNNTTLSNVMTWQANGNVGIGTTAPTSLLHLVTPSSARMLFETTDGAAGQASIDLKAGATQWWRLIGQGSANGGRFDFWNQTLNSSAMSILPSNYIGIGTQSPTAQLEVATMNGLSAIIRRGGATAQTPANLILQKTSGANAGTHGAVVNGDYVGRILFSASNGSSYLTNGTDMVGYAAGTQSATNNGGGIFFRTVPQNSVLQSIERMRIDENGNIGIGTSAPSAQLHTTGTVKFTGAGTPAAGKVLTSDATGNATWQPVNFATAVTNKTTDFTLTAADSGSVIVVTNATTPVIVTVPSTLSTGFYCQIIQQGAGQVKVVGDTGVTATSALGMYSRTTGSSIGIMLTSSTTAFVSGDTAF